MKIAVAGATGRVGKHVVDVVREQGHSVVAISRATGVDLITGAGLDEALTGVECVIDTATGPSPEAGPATEFFVTATRNLQAAASKAGVERIVVVSIIGIDGLTGGYNVAKLAHEKEMQAGPVPALILRASQFFEFIPQMMDWSRQGDTVYMSDTPVQPIAARAVAEGLVALAVDPSWAGGSPIFEIAGPQPESLADLAAQYAAKHDDPVRIVPATNPNDPDSEAYASGVLLPGPDARLAGPTFTTWLNS